MNITSQNIKKTIKQVLANYITTNIDELSFNISSLGNGLINQTYLVSFANDSIQGQWVLQQINKNVFPFPEQIIENTSKINQHLLLQKKEQKYPFLVPKQLRSIHGKECLKINNEYWRVVEYIPQSFSIESIENNKQSAQVAQGFGTFVAALADFPAETLHTIIPDFLNINTRINQLETAVKTACEKRREKAKSLCELPNLYQSFITEVNEITSQIPLRAVHHDTKINNLLFSRDTQQIAAVVDLDTCMPGYFMYDFGDMVRSCYTTELENSSSFNTAELDAELLTILAKNYISPLRNIITSEERNSLAIGVILLPLILGIRFLTDYLNNDTYFKVTHSHQNLVRASDQLSLFTMFLSNRITIQNTIKNVNDD